MIPARLYALLAGAVALLVCLGMGGAWLYQAGRQAGRASVQQKWLVERDRLVRAAEEAQAARAVAEDALERNTQEIADEADRKIADAIDARAAAVAAAERLQHRLAVLARTAAAGCGAGADAAAAAPGAASAAAGVLADVSGRLEARGRRYSDIAEAALTAAETCERAYDGARAKVNNLHREHDR